MKRADDASPRRRPWVIAPIVALALLGAWYSAHRRASAPVTAVDLANGRPKLLELGMGVCDQCRRMKPVMERAAKELAGVDVRVLDVRQPRNEALVERYHMVAMPLVVLVDASGKELWRHEGYVDWPALSRVVTERLGQR